MGPLEVKLGKILWASLNNQPGDWSSVPQVAGDGQGAEVVLWSPVGRKQVGKLFDQRLQELEKMILTYFN